MLNLAFIGLAPLAPAKTATEPLTIVTRSGEHKIQVEVAETEAQKAMGVMFRTEVPRGTGMLFPHKGERELTMWMRNTFVSLDMIFIKADGTVHRIASNTEPMSEEIIASEGKVSAVLELGAGEAERLAIQPGDKVAHRTFR